jgi:RHS repeat-associated protein
MSSRISFRAWVSLCLIPFSILTTKAQSNGRFTRGTGTNETYHSFVIPLDGQKGVSNAPSLGTTVAVLMSSHPNLYHFNATNTQNQIYITNRIQITNAIAAFGSKYGGTPLDFGQAYHFGAYAGASILQSRTNAFLVSITDRTTGAYLTNGAYTVPVPDVVSDWTTFLQAGSSYTFTFQGLTTTFSVLPDAAWGTSLIGSMVLTHVADSSATNYEYTIWRLGVLTNGVAMVQDADLLGTYTPLYTMDFDARPPSRAMFVDQPQFEGKPMPSAYAGKSLTELLAVQAVVTNAVSSTATNWTDLDNSPELRQHPTLDQFVTDMGSNALALTSYVFNEIELTDAIAYNNDTNKLADTSVNLGGVNRGALGVFMEGQGSPVEQCALLIYLLRRAGVPAAYIYGPYDGVQMLDARLSKLLRMQVKGAVNSNGNIYTTNNLISVNYPWVAAYINGQWQHLFPWLKDTEVVEGLNLYDYMPSTYNSGFKWVRQYLQGDANIFSLSSETDVPSVLFTKFVQKTLLTTGPGISVDDLGTHAFNRRVQYGRWSDFPTPFAVTNGTVNTVQNLTTITNIFPTWTNIWDTMSVRVFSNASTNKSLSTGDLRMVDLHNRKFLVRHQTNSSNYDLYFTLAAYRPSATNLTAFTNDVSLTNAQQLKMTLATTDDSITVRFTRKHHRLVASGVTNVNYWASYLGVGEVLQDIEDAPMRLGDLAAICLDHGRVSKKMVETWAQEYWNMQQQVKANPSITNTLSKDITQGTLPYLMGMAYYERVDRFGSQLQQLHKAQVGSMVAAGLSKLNAKRDPSTGKLTKPLTLSHPMVDMLYLSISVFGNSTLRPDEGADPEQPFIGFGRVLAAEGSAQEHKVIEDFYGKSGGISTVRLLLQAQQSGQPGMVELNSDNYTNYTGLRAYDTGLWTQVTNVFNSSYNGFSTVFITGAPITNNTVGYKGMGAMIFASDRVFALISNNQLPANGGWGLPLTDPIYDNTPDYNNISLTFNTSANSSWSVSYFDPSSPPATPPPLAETISWWDSASTYNNFSSYSLGGVNVAQQQQFDVAAFNLGLSGAAAFQDVVDNGCNYDSHVGPENAQLASGVADPVNAVTGEFYIEANDLSLPGPMPLLIRRNYSSQDVDLGASQFGFGWRPAYQPYLRFVTNLIFAAEMDGTVVAYRQPIAGTNFWRPTVADNPQLNNRSSVGIGSSANLFNNYITNVIGGGVTNYYLNASDGSLRRFQVIPFPVTGSSGNFDRTRPYLQQWSDVNGNTYTFSYQTNSTQPDFGQMRRIQSSNGNFLGFYYDTDEFSHIIEAYTGDGRRLYYDYDDHGDLITVTLPDDSQINYTYLHTVAVTNGVTNIFSTHLIATEEKPDGRVLSNTYDSLRRVIIQAATVGNDLNLVTNAIFAYSNNFTNLTNSVISGTTYITDVFGRTNSYKYAGNLITNITDALNQTETLVWFSNTNDAGYYPNSLKTKIDKRLLRTDFQYDSSGNLVQAILTGNLTGSGATNETATYSFTYTNRNLLSTFTDPSINKTIFYYTNTAYPMSPTLVVKMANTVATSTNLYFYTSVVQVVTNGAAVTTNSSYGLIQRMIRGGSSSNDFFFDGRGFLTQQINYTGTGDLPVTNTLFYTARGELEQRTDSAGRNERYAYDAMGRQTENEVYEANQSAPLAWKYSYFNGNGELVWTDGPRYNPEDYVWRDYDGAGRKITEVHLRSEAKSDGSGVQAAAGDDLYACSFYQYDPFSNLTNEIAPLGNHLVRQFDAIGQLTNEVFYNAAGVALATNQFGHEPGGLVSRSVNPLGGVTTRQFTYTGKATSQSNPDGSTNGWLYYMDGRVQKQFLCNGSYWETIYDDANLRVTNYFKNTTGSILATKFIQFDTRNNVIQQSDLEGNVATNLFDGLNRIKVAAGAPSLSISPSWDFSTLVTNITQQILTYIYDASSQTTTVSNAVGEKTVTVSDAMGRPTQVSIYPTNSGTAVRVITTVYGADQNSVTVTNGTGSTAIASTIFTDNDGHLVLSITYPTNGIREYVLQKYDRNGNRIAQQQCSISGSTVTVWSTNGWSYDGLNRVLTETNRDGVYNVVTRDALGDVLSRVMPNGLTWNATYVSDGRISTEQVTGGALSARSMTYQYYSSGNPFAGMLQTITDGRSTIRSNSYDDFLRVATVTTTGSAAEQNTTTSYLYDNRSLVTSLNQSFASTNTGPGTYISRSYGGFKELLSESISSDNGFAAGASQYWDNAGRRTALGGIGFGYRADGLMTSAGGSTFGFGDNGLIMGRTNSVRSYAIASRDGSGRILQANTYFGGSNILAETLAWRNDGHVNSYSAVRGDGFTDARNYTYATASQRLTQESFNLSGSLRFTNNYTLDNGQAGRLGILTSISTPAQSTNNWLAPASGGLDGLNRVAQEQSAIIRRPATGLALGAGTVTATLDNNPINVLFDSLDASDGRWRANLDLTPGSHTLKLSAMHPSGQYTAYATNTFTATGAADTLQDQYDGNGNVTKRSWVSAGGQTNRTQMLTWDAFDRLIKVSERDAYTNGFDFVSVYDGLGRRLRTTLTMVVSNSLTTNPWDVVSTVDSSYDPQVRFLEVGVTVNRVSATKTYGPDLNGIYGGLNGLGGFETDTPDGTIPPCTLIQDAFGNALGCLENGKVNWRATRLSSYGPVPGYQSASLSLNNPIDEVTSWRGKRVDETGFIYMGARYYDPVAGRFLSADPLGHGATMDLYSFAGGDPVNRFDPDGRYDKQTFGANSWDDMSNIGEQIRREEQFIAAASGLVDMIPLIGGAKMWVELNTGKDLFTGERQDQNQYLQAAGVVLNFLPILPAAISLAGETTMLSPGAGAAFRGASAEFSLASEATTTTVSTGAGEGVTINVSLAQEASIAQKSEQLEFEFVKDLTPANAQNNPLQPSFSHGEQGQLLAAYAKIEPYHIGTGTPTTDAARSFARSLGFPTDDAGHAIGNNLGGLGGATSGNIFPQAPSVNRGAFAQFEQQVARQVLAGNEVYTGIIPQYAEGATRPYSITYQVSVNGTLTTRIFPNP